MSNLEKNRLNAILVKAAKLAGKCVLFRNNVGEGWIGKLIKRTADVVTLGYARPLQAGLCPGSSDLIGWNSVIITPDMVGKKVAVFTAIEDKSKADNTRANQDNFLNRVREAGGCCGVARDADQAIEIIKNYQPV